MMSPPDQELRALLSGSASPDPAILIELVPLLPGRLLPRALEIALDVQYPAMDLRAHLVEDIAERIALEDQPVVNEALGVARANLFHNPDGTEFALIKVLASRISEYLLPTALQIANHIYSSVADRIEALAILAGLLPTPVAEAVLRDAFEQGRGFEQESRRAYLISPLIPFLRGALLSEALEFALELKYPSIRVELLIKLIPYLSDDERKSALESALSTARSIEVTQWRSRYLAELEAFLRPTDQAGEFRADGDETTDRAARGEVQIDASDVEREANQAIRRIRANPWYVDLVVDKLGLIPAEYRGPIVSRTVNALKTITREEELEEKIILLAPFLEEIHLEQALVLARQIQDGSRRAGALVVLARRYAQTTQPSLAEEALANVESIEDVRRYAKLLDGLASVLNQSQKHEALLHALDRMRPVRKSETLADMLWSLAPHFPSDLFPQAWTMAEKIRSPQYRADAMTAFALYLPPENRLELLGEALETILSLRDESAYYLQALAMILPEPLLRQAVSAAEEFEDGLARTDTLAVLLPELAGFVSGEQRLSILRTAFQQSFYAAVPRPGGKKGHSNPEIGSEAGQRAFDLLQKLPDREGQWLLDEWLGSLSFQTQREMVTGGSGVDEEVISSGRRVHEGLRAEAPEVYYERHAGPPSETTTDTDQPAEPQTQERVVNTGFALFDRPDQRLSGTNPLAVGESYYFWLDVDRLDPLSIETQPASLPIELEEKPVILRVVLYGFQNEIKIFPGSDIGELELQVEGSAVVKSQPGNQAAPLIDKELLQKRLYFPVQAPDREGIFRLRCHIYYEQILIQARLIETLVMRIPQQQSGALKSSLDYSLAQSLQPGHLTRLQIHRLSLMLNDNGDTTHTLRFFGQKNGEPKKYDAHLLPTELEVPMLNTRKTLWNVSWGNEHPWDPDHYPGQKYRYKSYALDQERLEKDLISLAINGYILYNAIIDKLTGGRIASDELADLMRSPGLVQIALRQSPSQVLPAALFYDYDLDTQAPKKELCDTFKDALHDHTPLEDTPCFQGACPSLSKQSADRYVCPSGFWGFRHMLGLPFSASPGTDIPPEIIVHNTPQMVVGIATNLDLVEEHVAALKNIRTDLGWYESEHRDEMLELMKTVRSHLIYFYCHGGVTKDIPFLQLGSGADYIEGSNFRSKHIYWNDPRPLIFVNGCHTTALDPNQIINLVQDFISTGGAGVIGTEITIFEVLACEFAVEFLEKFLKSHASVGEAIRSARLRLLERGNPLGLVYTPFVLPSLHLQE